MLMEGALALAVAVLACDNHPVPKEEDLPKGPNLKTKARSAIEPREILVVKKIGWSPDGSLVHYWLQYQNRKRAKKKGLVIIGHLVDVSTGKTLKRYQVEQKGYLEPALKKVWGAAKPKAWGDKLVKALALVPAGKKRTRPPRKLRDAGKLRLKGTKTTLGWVSAWRLSRWFGWKWRPVNKRTKAGQKFDPWLTLQHKPKGAKRWKTLHRHQPTLDFHAALGHRFTWEAAREREDAGDLMIHQYCYEEGEKCDKALREHGLGPNFKHAYAGEVWTWWSPSGDAVLAFWDDKRRLYPDSDHAMSVYRSYVTVHALKARAPTGLVPADPKPTPPAMAVAQAGAKTMGAAAGGKAPHTDAPLQLASKERASAGAKAKKGSGCGCQSNTGGGLPGLVGGLLLLLTLWVRRSVQGLGNSKAYR